MPSPHLHIQNWIHGPPRGISRPRGQKVKTANIPKRILVIKPLKIHRQKMLYPNIGGTSHAGPGYTIRMVDSLFIWWVFEDLLFRCFSIFLKFFGAFGAMVPWPCPGSKGILFTQVKGGMRLPHPHADKHHIFTQALQALPHVRVMHCFVEERSRVCPKMNGTSWWEANVRNGHASGWDWLKQNAWSKMATQGVLSREGSEL